jgi:hypothetical protein
VQGFYEFLPIRQNLRPKNGKFVAVPKVSKIYRFMANNQKILGMPNNI